MTNISYALCETVSDLTLLFLRQDQLPADSRESVRLIIEWSESFETQYADEEWIDRDYLEIIEGFFDEKYQGWLNAATPCSVRKN